MKQPDLFADDPVLRQKAAAEYVGIKPRTLRKMDLPRVPIPGTRRLRGYRRSVLNRLIAETLGRPK